MAAPAAEWQQQNGSKALYVPVAAECFAFCTCRMVRHSPPPWLQARLTWGDGVLVSLCPPATLMTLKGMSQTAVTSCC